MTDRTWPDPPIGPDPPPEFWEQARLVLPPPGRKVPIALRVDRTVLDAFKAAGPGHLTRMAAVLRAYVVAQQVTQGTMLERPARPRARRRATAAR